MDNARFLQLRQLFDEFVQLPIRERSSFLDQLSRTDAEMASELAKYLSAHDKAGSLSMTPPSPQPLVIGPYRILKRVGGGGMGEVFQAVRDDGAFRKYVALKLIREDFIREEQAVERFQAERQVLAALEHPNVARILDGGNTEGGAPYYVMELVDGKPLDEYCDEKKLDVEKRLLLMREICDAVHYLHNHQVVHRDLKPANILVTDEGIPKILDFGIAKILGPVSPDLSALHGSPLTPSYASPEQLHGRPVTGSSDVFTLGVILYQVLVGKLPDRLKTLLPSVAVSNEKNRMPETDTQLRRKISGDLDKIVMRALESDPGDRYRSAQEFSEDIGRYLDHRTVIATRASPADKAIKFLFRNRIGAVIAAVILILGAATGWLAFRNVLLEKQMYSISQPIEQLKVPASAQDVDGILRDLRLLETNLRNPLLQDETLPPDQMRVRQAILGRSVDYLGGLEPIAQTNVRVAKQLAEAYVQLAELQHSDQKPRLADKSGAASSYTAAARQYVRVAAAEPENQDIRKRLGNVEQRLTVLETRVSPEVVAILRPRVTPETTAPPTSQANPSISQPRSRPLTNLEKPSANTSVNAPVQTPAPPSKVAGTRPAMPGELEDLSLDAKTKVETAERYYLARKGELEAQGMSPRSDVVSTYTLMKVRLDQAQRYAEAGKYEECGDALRAAREFASRIQRQF